MEAGSRTAATQKMEGQQLEWINSEALQEFPFTCIL
jgi:hypothetical protein